MFRPNLDVSYLGATNFRQAQKPFGIRQADRLSHMYAIGRTGTGKSSLLLGLARQDLAAGRGFALIDPHGDLVERLYASATGPERARIIYVDVPDSQQPYGYNPLRRVREDRIPVAVSGLLETFRKLWPSAWGVRMEHVFRATLYALIERPGSTLPDILRLYADDRFRREIVAKIRNPVVRTFFSSELENYPSRYRAEAMAPIQNKLGALLADPVIRHVLVEPAVDLGFRRLMDEGKVVLVNLSKGCLGEDATMLLGGLLVSTFGLAAFSRAELEPAARRPFFLYVDEFQTFTTLAFVNMMSELRKQAFGLVLAHQHRQQLQAEVQHAVLGNAGTLISFRVGADDAPLLAREFQPVFGVSDLLNLPNRCFYLKLMIDGAPARPFSARTLDT